MRSFSVRFASCAILIVTLGTGSPHVLRPHATHVASPKLASTLTAAPADRYFGKLKMSAIRVRMSLAQLKSQLETHQRSPQDILNLTYLTDDAYRAWARAYPKDSWLASTGYLLANLYKELQGADARSHAINTLTFVRRAFPKTKYAYWSKLDLERGVALRPEIPWAAAGTPSSSPSASPTTSASPLPTASGAPSPLPTPKKGAAQATPLW